MRRLAAGHEKHKAIATILHRSTEEEYLAQVRVSPLVSVRGGAHLAKSLNVIDGRSAGQPEIESLSWC